MKQPGDLWYKNAIFYELHLRAFCDSSGDGHGDLPGLISKLDYLRDLGIDCIWLLPFYPSPLKDDGYDIADFYNIDPAYGTLDDFRRLLQEAHSRGLRVITDLVLNHTSDQHPWFQSARKYRNSPYRNYYVWSDSDKKYSQARIIFVDTEASNWTWDETAGQFYWHRFYSSQPDLNYDNPAVRAEILNIIEYWLELGLDGFRADAVPYLIEREGTNCENLPETHKFLKEIRRFIDQRYPGRILLAEANQWPQDLRLYLGDGDEFHMAFHFPLMPRIFMSLRRKDKISIEKILQATPPIPENCQWCIFLRNHDELTLEMVTEEERQWMWREYAPDPRMRLNLGIRRRLAPLLDSDARQIELAHAILLALPGSPVIYYGDEIGMGDNIYLKDRDGVRTPMQWDDSLNAGFSSAPPEKLYSPLIDTGRYRYQIVNVKNQIANPDSLYNRLRQLFKTRKQHPAFSQGECEFIETHNPSVLVLLRHEENEHLLAVHNLSSSLQNILLELPGYENHALMDLFSQKNITRLNSNRLRLTLQPYQYQWAKMQPEL